MATDGIFTKTSPNYSTQVASSAFDEIKENFEYLERGLLMQSLFFIIGHNSSFTYGVTYTDRVESIAVKNSTGGSVGTCTLTYSTSTSTPYQLNQEVWAINSKTLTYNYTYSSGKVTLATLTTIA